jgi:hypothetical protein
VSTPCIEAPSPLDGVLAVLEGAPLLDVLVLGVRQDAAAPVPLYAPSLLAGFWLRAGDAYVWFGNDQGELTAAPASRLAPPEAYSSDPKGAVCVLSARGFALDPGLPRCRPRALELVAGGEAALREGVVTGVFLQCENGEEFFANAWSFEGLTFRRSRAYAAWLAELAPHYGGWCRRRWDERARPWRWGSGRALRLTAPVEAWPARR